MDDFTYEVFQAYYQLKAFDVISAGQYKKRLSQSRENGDQWAVNLYNQHNVMHHKIKELSVLVNDMTNPLTKALQEICRDVMTCAQPPIKLQAGLGRCVLTGENCEHCLDLSKAGKDNKTVLVQNKYWYFFVFLWYCSKIEYIIRSCTKQWLADNDLKSQTTNYDELCNRLLEKNKSEMQLMFDIFRKAFSYVITTLQNHQTKYRTQAFLNPPDEFMQDG